MKIGEQDFERLMETLDRIHIDTRYIPSEAELFYCIRQNPEKYALYLLWFSEHHPEPKTEKERDILRQINKITNHIIEIV